MDQLLLEYFPILIFIAIAVVIGCVAIGASYLVVPQHPDVEKTSAYECGFEAFDDAVANSTSAFIWSQSCSSFSI